MLALGSANWILAVLMLLLLFASPTQCDLVFQWQNSVSLGYEENWNSSPVLVDIDGDQVMEVFQASSFLRRVDGRNGNSVWTLTSHSTSMSFVPTTSLANFAPNFCRFSGCLSVQGCSGPFNRAYSSGVAIDLDDDGVVDISRGIANGMVSTILIRSVWCSQKVVAHDVNGDSLANFPQIVASNQNAIESRSTLGFIGPAGEKMSETSILRNSDSLLVIASNKAQNLFLSAHDSSGSLWEAQTVNIDEDTTGWHRTISFCVLFSFALAGVYSDSLCASSTAVFAPSYSSSPRYFYFDFYPHLAVGAFNALTGGLLSVNSRYGTRLAWSSLQTFALGSNEDAGWMQITPAHRADGVACAVVDLDGGGTEEVVMLGIMNEVSVEPKIRKGEAPYVFNHDRSRFSNSMVIPSPLFFAAVSRLILPQFIVYSSLPSI